MPNRKSNVKPKVRIKKTPDHHDAEIVLKLYDLRREAVMRESRKAMARFLPRTFDDILAVLKLDHPDNAAWRQVSSYYEMAFGMARHGIVNPDYLAENTGEGFFLYAKMEPFLEQFRRELSPLAFGNSEWMVKHSPAARLRMELFQARVAKMLASQ